MAETTNRDLVPIYHELFEPILSVLREAGESLHLSELDERVASEIELGEEERLLPHDPENGGRTEFEYQMAWSRTYLKKAGLVDNESRGEWALTEEGRNASIENPMKILYRAQGADEDAYFDDEAWDSLVTEAMDAPEPAVRSVRRLLEIFGFSRRGANVVALIRGALRNAGLETYPPFDKAHIDAQVEFAPLDGSDEGGEVEDEPSISQAPQEDPIPRVAQLAAANRTPLSVQPDARLECATTLMMQNDFSQLPVMQSEHTLKGFISWETIGEARMTGENPEYVRDAMATNPEVIDADVPLIDAVAAIERRQFVLVRGLKNKIHGPVTATDIADQFRQLAEPFLVMGMIEGQLRRLLWSMPLEVIRNAKDGDDEDRTVESVADLTFGEQVRILENPDNWALLGLELDRAAVVRQLHEVRVLRNRIMHFDPDPLENEHKELLARTSRFLTKLVG